MSAKFTFRLKNLNEVVDRANKLAGSIIRGSGQKSLVSSADKIVSDDYINAFRRGGFTESPPWRTSKGRVTLRKTEAFKNSFAGVDQKEISSYGNLSLVIKFYNEFTHPRMTKPYVAALKGGIQLTGNVKIQIDFRGPEGGISKSASAALFRKFRAILMQEARRVGYQIV